MSEGSGNEPPFQIDWCGRSYTSACDTPDRQRANATITGGCVLLLGASSGCLSRRRRADPGAVVIGADIEERDGAGRTPVHVAAFQSHDDAVTALAEAGADLNALENARYDILTIAAVAGDVDLVNRAIALGGNPGNVTSRYDGTALIAAAHLGHDAVVRALIDAGAPLDHVNNLGWTALIEAVILGDGGPRHVKTVAALVRAGADVATSDRRGISPLTHARSLGYTEIAALIAAAVN